MHELKEQDALKENVLELKGEMSLLNVLLLRTTELAAIEKTLTEKLEKAGQLLNRSPIIVDCSTVVDQLAELDFAGLKQTLTQLGLVPVGLRQVPENLEEQVQQSGWAILRGGKAIAQVPVETEAAPQITPQSDSEPMPSRLMLLERPVRSGQQVYFPHGDIVVMQQTSAGSELLAGGSVHVYGTLRGRVLAGIQGDTMARIFCQRLEAELIAIAGRYKLLDELDASLKGQAVMVYLDDDKLKIVPI
ncbi:septum site-determining protein MinC [Thiolinea disciformis]|uniref:septum site-determining protein MinC n=1 Tax=Thiolinea disciformis TaxID=125614 RepID=UPI0003630201|nr:septum site-determining protein MinC [Thiolinea disciformis]